MASTQQRFRRRQHLDGRPTIRSCCYPSFFRDTCCGQISCWYIEQSTGRSRINIRGWRRGADVSHDKCWIQCFWRDGCGGGIWWDAFVAYASSHSEPSFAAKAEFTAASATASTSAGRFARVVLDLSVSAFLSLADCLLCFVFNHRYSLFFPAVFSESWLNTVFSKNAAWLLTSVVYTLVLASDSSSPGTFLCYIFGECI